MKYTCPCCGFQTLTEKPPGTYEVCSICFWEDDIIQFNHPDEDGGANTVSLRQAQQNFVDFGACDKDSLQHARKPASKDQKDPGWKPLNLS
ncbi:hypothetical protein J7E71_25200 [Mesobacillus foraminis]|uniref:CPCC family cysteine-rich protein n=1 Tax=Mesobacillus foraminis TaxID=279826 RepID=UPI001BE6F72A|nr:CPCC family cysteine-rich protein [Mesobacillus foraminis]MBT2759172.1 hypothetical protein [Mesobacillus foraminis]